MPPARCTSAYVYSHCVAIHFAATAIARELAAFIWAINREVVGSYATANQ
jgi:hypothetical protein